MAWYWLAWLLKDSVRERVKQCKCKTRNPKSNGQECDLPPFFGIEPFMHATMVGKMLTLCLLLLALAACSANGDPLAHQNSLEQREGEVVVSNAYNA
jgi:hypothetical protein